MITTRTLRTIVLLGAVCALAVDCGGRSLMRRRPGSDITLPATPKEEALAALRSRCPDSTIVGNAPRTANRNCRYANVDTLPDPKFPQPGATP